MQVIAYYLYLIATDYPNCQVVIFNALKAWLKISNLTIKSNKGIVYQFPKNLN